MKSISLFAALVAFVVLTPIAAIHAAEMQAGKTVFIENATPLLENAYLIGGDVNVSAPAEKDLTALGGKIIVNAPVAEDVMLGGGTIDVLDEVSGDVRIAGGEVTIQKNVGGDLVVLAGTVTVLPGATISGDVIVFGGTVDIEGDVMGALTIHGEDVTVNSAVTGPASIKSEHSVTFGEKSAFGNTLAYRAPKEAEIVTGANLGAQVVFTKNETKTHDFFGAFFAIFGILILVKFIGMLLAALLTVSVFKRASLALSMKASEKLLPMLGIGFLATIVPPIAIVLLALSFVGLYLAFIVGVLYLFALLSAGIFMCILAGALLSKWIRKEMHADWQWTILGTVLVFVLGIIPVIGWVTVLVLFFTAMGAVATSLREDAKAKM
jgi:hypothetical protein